MDVMRKIGFYSRPRTTGHADTGCNVTNSKSIFSYHVAAGVECISNSCNFYAYALVPVDRINPTLNSGYQGGTLDSYALDVWFAITLDLKASPGLYYQSDDLDEVNGSDLLNRLSC